jgi:uncharacterized membrane protein
MKEAIIQFLESVFGSAHAAIVFFMSAIPVTEQRATIPLGILTFKMDIWLVFILAFLGSLLPVPFLLLLFKRVLLWMKKISWLSSVSGFIEQKVQKQASKFEKTSEIGLVLFVAIPLPGTGLWTGSAVASLLGFNLKKSFICVTLGGLLSAAALTLTFALIRSGINIF